MEGESFVSPKFCPLSKCRKENYISANKVKVLATYSDFNLPFFFPFVSNAPCFYVLPISEQTGVKCLLKSDQRCVLKAFYHFYPNTAFQSIFVTFTNSGKLV